MRKQVKTFQNEKELNEFLKTKRPESILNVLVCQIAEYRALITVVYLENIY